MVLLAALILTLIALTVGIVVVLGVGGAVFTVAFADVIVCVGILVIIIRYLIKKKGGA